MSNKKTWHYKYALEEWEQWRTPEPSPMDDASYYDPETEAREEHLMAQEEDERRERRVERWNEMLYKIDPNYDIDPPEDWLDMDDDDEAEFINVVGDWVYYTNGINKHTFYRKLTTE